MENQQSKENVLHHSQVEIGKNRFATKTVKASDIIVNRYGGSLTAEMMTIPILSIQIREKELDKPLSKISTFFAGMLSIKTKHEFLLFEAEEDFITVDYYEENRLVIRVGDIDMVLGKNQSWKRLNSEIVKEKSGLEWRKDFKKGVLSFGQLLDYLLGLKLRPFKKLGYNGADFSREVFNYIKSNLVKSEFRSHIK